MVGRRQQIFALPKLLMKTSQFYASEFRQLLGSKITQACLSMSQDLFLNSPYANINFPIKHL